MYARLRDHQFSLYEDYARKRYLQGKSLLILLWIYRHPKGISQQTLTETTHLFTDILTQEFMRLIKEICPDI